MLRIALVGLGLASKRHIESAAALSNDICISACIDVDFDRAQAVALTCGAKAYRTLSEALPFCDIVALCTPPAYRCDFAIEAMEAGKHVLLEKPMCVDLEDGRAMLECAERTGCLLTMGFNNRFRKGFIMLKDTIDSGKLGKLQSFYIHRQGMGLLKPNVKTWRSGCGHAIESLSHDLDILRFLVGDVKALKAFTLDTLSYAPGYDNNAVVSMELASGALANLYSCWSSPLAFNTRGAIGSEGAASLFGPKLWNLKDFRYQSADMQEPEITVIDDWLDEKCYIEEYRAFIAAVRKEKPLAVTGIDGYKVLELSHAIMESSKTGKTIYLD